MLEVPKSPNAPEYVEMTLSKVRETEDSIAFEFNFARSMEGEEISELANDTHRAMWQLVMPRLHQKGWVSEDGSGVYVTLETETTSEDDGKRWTFIYRRHDPDTPSLN